MCFYGGSGEKGIGWGWSLGQGELRVEELAFASEERIINVFDDVCRHWAWLL